MKKNLLKKNLCLVLAGIVTTTLLFTACGSGAGKTQETGKAQETAKEEQAAPGGEVTGEAAEDSSAEEVTGEAEAPAAEASTSAPSEAAGDTTTAAAAEAADAAGTGLETYTDAKGWSVQYDPEVITVNKLEDGAGFVYTGDSAGTNMITIRCVPDKQPEELLYEVTGEWGADDSIQEEITRTEGFLPGTTDKWGFWRMLNTSEEGSAMTRAAMAGEYNGEVLLFDITAHMTGEDPTDYAVNDEMAAFINSITYENYEPQVMYEYVPGTYVQEAPEAAEGEDAVDRARTIILHADHTGILSFQDDVNVLWGSNKLTSADGSFEYEYTIEGDSLMLNQDGDWLTFQKTEPETDAQ